MTHIHDAGRTPAQSATPRRRTAILLTILLVVAIPSVTIAVIYPSFGAGCAIAVGAVGTLISVLQSGHNEDGRT